MTPVVGDTVKRRRLDGQGEEELRVTYVAVGPYVRSDGKGVIPGVVFIRTAKA